MCGRFNVTSDPLQAVFMDLLDQNYPGPENFNVAPTANVWVIRGTQRTNTRYEAVEARWWLTPNWAKEISTKYSMFNARAENLEKSPAFKLPFRRKRCVVPISGYFEWKRVDEQKQPYHVKLTENNALMLAGLWDEWHNPEFDEVLSSFTIVTCEAARPMKFLHHRQPVMLGPSEVTMWLHPDTEVEELYSLVRPRLPQALEIVPVSNYVGNTRNNGPKCIEPTGSSQHIAVLN